MVKWISDRTVHWLAWLAFATALGPYVVADITMGTLTLSLHQNGSWANSSLCSVQRLLLTC